MQVVGTPDDDLDAENDARDETHCTRSYVRDSYIRLRFLPVKRLRNEDLSESTMRRFILILLASRFLMHTTDAMIHRRNVGVDESDRNALEVSGPIREVLAQTGGTAALPCKLSDPGAGIVTWVRRKDRQLLTVGAATHSVETRFMVKPSTSDWTLLIRGVTLQDAGLYECQVPTVPVQHQFVRLKITEAYSVIPGAPDLHVKQGSSLRLECQLVSATEPPVYVFWYRQGRMINYDAEPGVRVEATKSGSILIVNKTKPSHGGNYTCTPSNARSAYVVVHVIEEEEKPAAMHGGDRRSSSAIGVSSRYLLIFVVIIDSVVNSLWTNSRHFSTYLT
ncbi:neural cell adhesion molecule 2-like isoform X3 [Athalia rosae]|uniref:neural cell adhesion molecule 2-like isoform X3 n=1 Tax=Athalia rosae TaxID=37344 RepID=UPI002033F406|nr:neural cell adhesion molecule 2-like isoform X3 [Athalia rosae]